MDIYEHRYNTGPFTPLYTAFVNATQIKQNGSDSQTLDGGQITG